jgi:hypothetical protein
MQSWNLKSSCALLVLAALVASTATAASNEKLRIAAQARVADSALADAQFEFTCTTGKGGALSVAVVLPAPESVPTFPLEKFEGPDGIGENRMLATWSILGPRAMTVTSSISGWRGVDGDGFLLASSRTSAKSSDLARLLKRYLADGGQPLWLVVAPPEAGAKLEAHALPSARRTQLAMTLAPCLTQVRPRP